MTNSQVAESRFVRSMLFVIGVGITLCGCVYSPAPYAYERPHYAYYPPRYAYGPTIYVRPSFEFHVRDHDHGR